VIRRTWSIRGKTPLIHCRSSWAKLSVISAVTTNPHVYTKLLPGKTAKTGDMISFLKKIGRRFRRPLFIVWDNAQIHKSTAIRAFIKNSKGRLQVYYLPPYAPELNADEGVWSYLKWHELANYCPESNEKLIAAVRRGLQRIQNRKNLIRSFMKNTPLNFSRIVN
jgi:transposase